MQSVPITTNVVSSNRSLSLCIRYIMWCSLSVTYGRLVVLSGYSCFFWVRFFRVSVWCFVDRFFVHLSFLFWPLRCLPFNLWLPIWCLPTFLTLWNQRKISWDQRKMSWDQRKMSWDQSTMSWDQRKMFWDKNKCQEIKGQCPEIKEKCPEIKGKFPH
jgi:hypothetical protein